MNTISHFLLESQSLSGGAGISQGNPAFATNLAPLNYNLESIEGLFSTAISATASGISSRPVLQDLSQETTSVSYANQRKLTAIERLNLAYGDKIKVFGFLKSNSELLDLVLEAYSVIRRHFRFAPLSLKLHWNPETSEEDYLIFTISTSLTAEEAIKELDMIDDEWWLDNMHRSDDKLSIDLVYK